jgi:hypothetical protein
MLWTFFVVVALLLVAGVWATVRLLHGHTARGGVSDAAAADTAAQALAWTDAFRGAASKENPAWDGHSIKLAPPQEHF